MSPTEWCAARSHTSLQPRPSCGPVQPCRSCRPLAGPRTPPSRLLSLLSFRSLLIGHVARHVFKDVYDFSDGIPVAGPIYSHVGDALTPLALLRHAVCRLLQVVERAVVLNLGR